IVANGEVIALANGRQYADASADEGLRNAVLEALDQYHSGRPLSPAMPKDELQARVGRPPPALLADLLDRMTVAGQIVVDGAGARVAGHEVDLSGEQRQSLDAMMGLARSGGFSPPTRDAVLASARRRPGESQSLLELAISAGDLVPVAECVYHGSTLVRAEQLIEEFAAENGPFTIANLRDLTGSSRKYVVPLAEHLDGIGFTRRQGDERVVIRPART
ncbi:MAG TPA: SelB C-terminal domain-containing protein, partial [Armatimonadota bacterium]|nr:SelB C-terminal domain-containing protein [Armatimonadota bacterium]